MNSSEKDIGILIGEMTALKNMVAANHVSSEASRRLLHQEQNEMRIALVQLDNKVETGNRETTQIKDRLESAEKVASEINTWRERLTGMKMLALAQWAFLAITLGGALTLGWKWIATKLGI